MLYLKEKTLFYGPTIFLVLSKSNVTFIYSCNGTVVPFPLQAVFIINSTCHEKYMLSKISLKKPKLL